MLFLFCFVLSFLLALDMYNWRVVLTSDKQPQNDVSGFHSLLIPMDPVNSRDIVLSLHLSCFFGVALLNSNHICQWSTFLRMSLLCQHICLK